jgi:hypothetical protein
LIKREGLGFFIIGVPLLHLPDWVEVEVEVEVTLRLMDSQSVSLGVDPHLGLMTRYILLFDNYGLDFVGCPL